MQWYETREAGALQHRGQAIPSGKKIFLSEDQAKTHNTNGEKVQACDNPIDPKEVATLADWKIYKLRVEREKTESNEI